MGIVIVLQARTNSSRLPGKILLPVSGYPAAILAAKRVMNKDSTVIIATSNERTDDHFAYVAKSYGLNVFRGELNNVLKRFVDCLSGYSDDSIVVRLTADNVFPDADLIKEIVEDFVLKKRDYLCLNGGLSGLPYGVSAEVMALDKIREAYIQTSDPFDLEHVTPYIRRKYGNQYYTKYLPLELGMYRCTVDNFNDYINVSEIFTRVLNPIEISTFDLIAMLKEKYKLINNKNKSIVLGTAQLGLDYGINNELGKPTKASSFAILSHAVENGIQYIDTASAYGESESIIGEWLNTGWHGRVKVITKLSPLVATLALNAEVKEVNHNVEKSLYQSLINLKTNKIDVLMLHRAEHLTIYSGAILKRVLSWKQKGSIGALGVSVQSPSELGLALNHPEIEYIQLPFNILDFRWGNAIKKLLLAKQKRSIKIHVRSVFLQGLLLTDKVALWEKAHENEPMKIIKWLEETSSVCDDNNISSLCLNYVISNDWVDAIVVGVDSKDHLESAFNAIKLNSLAPSVLNEIHKSRPLVSELTLDPSVWRTKT
ncbi:aldo/keto reductase [Pseudomonadales bacterium]|nr:aldo/keto reductase [Pseudomonadales bacterium]